VMINVPS